MFLLINKAKNEAFNSVHEFQTLEGAATFCETDPSDLHWQVKRTGRWDSEDGAWVLIPAQPEGESK